jgi:phytoene dehydrogenase-like protein
MKSGAMAEFDGVIIGAGHNGLTLAAYLTRAGLRIAVLERNARIGGGASTEEPILPGYKLNLHANFYMGIGLSPLLRDLELHRFGFSYIEPPVQQAAIFRDGTGIVVYKDLDRTCASLARFSKQDADTFRDLWHTYCEEMRPLLVSLLYNAPMPREVLIERLSGAKAKELLSHAQHDLFSVVRKHFVDERIRTLFTSYMHVITTENVPGAGIVFPAIFANIASFTLPAGGAVTLPLSLARIVEAAGGEIITGADVREIVVKNGRATGVKLADGRIINGGKFVASAIDFPTTVEMAGEELFPEPVREKAKSWHWGNHSLVTPRLSIPMCRGPTIFSSAWTRSRMWQAASRTAPRKNFPKS